MTMPDGQLEFLNGIREAIIWWGVPLMILAGIATHLTSRRSVARQREMNIDASASPQTAIMNKLMLYMFPLFVVVGGPFFPLAILFYWLANNSWTFGQLWIAHRMQDKRALAASQVVEEAKEAAKFTKPLPGAKPRPAAGRPVIEPSKITPSGNGSTDSATPGGSAGGAPGAAAAANGAGGSSTPAKPASGAAASANGAGGSSTPAKPAPGARPQRPPGQAPKKKKRTGRR